MKSTAYTWPSCQNTNAVTHPAADDDEEMDVSRGDLENPEESDVDEVSWDELVIDDDEEMMGWSE